LGIVRGIPGPERFSVEIAVLLLSALVVFTFTVCIGILNGTDIVDFDQRIILTHVHTGTLGWLTLCVFAACLWLFGEGEGMTPGQEKHARYVSLGSIVVFLLYNFAFAVTYNEWRPALGTVSLVMIVGMFTWVFMRARYVEMTTPHLGILVAVATSVVGAVIGVLLGLRLATGDNWIPEGGEDAHPATMVVGFLIPVAMALGEWALTWPRPGPLTRAGWFQMGLPFVGGVMLMVGLLWEIDPLVQLSLPVELVGIIIYMARMRAPLLGAFNPSAEWRDRFAAASPPYLFIVIALFIFLIADYEGDADLIPTHKILAVDHLTFIGAMTNAIFALLLSICAARVQRLPLFPGILLVAMNVGLVLFMVGLYGDNTTLKRIGTPILGASLLSGIAFFLYALVSPGEQGAEPQAAVVTA
jgi:hypothetical protein